MAKRFNVTGNCFPTKHYMADVSHVLEHVKNMVDNEEYFAINRPRQFGKTTTLYTLEEMLEKTGEYLVFNISFEGIGDAIFENEQLFSRGFVELLAGDAPPLKKWLLELAAKTNSLKELAETITEIAEKTDKKTVVLIDEVDKSSNNQLFVSFLAMLRNKYLGRGKTKTFHSVVLAGVHDVKSLKLKLRPEEHSKYNSPWNIATDFLVDMHFHPQEIKPMLDDYVRETGVKMDTQEVAEVLFYYTSGYPYLVSKLCKTIDEIILPKKNVKEWTEDDVYNAVQLLLKERGNSNFDTIIKTLHEDEAFYEFVFSIIIDGETPPYSSDNRLINIGLLHGIFAQSEDGNLMIHNRIYRERIANMMISEWETMTIINKEKKLQTYSFKDPYVLPDNKLNLELALLRFQAFMREQYNRKDRNFLETNGRLVFLAFMKPIINGSGYDFKEPQISEERRLDVVITFYQYKYVAELKIWRGEVAHEKGLNQLANYLDRLNLSEGYLVIFDHKEIKTWGSGWINHKDKRIFIVWV